MRLASHAPGAPQWAFDESTFLWNIWYLKDSLIDGLRSPLHSDLIYYPLGIDLVLYTYNFFNAFVAQPIHLALGLLVSSNITLLFSTIFSGYGVYLLVSDLFRRTPPEADNPPRPSAIRLRTWAALAAGILYAFASNRAIYATLGHYDMVTTQWIPFYVLTFLRSLDAGLSGERRRRSALLAGIFFAFNGLAEMITALFLALFSLIVLLVRWLSRNQGLRRSDWLYLSVIGATGFVLWSPILVPILIQFLTEDFSLKGWGEAIPLSVDLLGLLTPTLLHPIWGGDLVEGLRAVQLRALLPGSEATGFRDINTLFLGWASVGLALVGWLAYRSRLRIWSWTGLIFGLFALGPFLQLNGRYRFDLDGVETSFPLPYALLHYIPVIKANRAPNRNSVIVMLALAVLAAYGIYWLLQNRRRWAQSLISLGLAVLILFEHLALPLPLSDHRVPEVYAQIAADPRPVSVLHAPLGWRNSFGVFGAERTILQYYQSVHQKPMLGGNISRAPDFKMDYFRRIPLFEAIRQLEFNGSANPELLAAAAEQADALVYLYNVGYVLLMPPIPERFPYADHWQPTWDFYRSSLPLEPDPFWRGDGIEAYRVIQPPGRDRFVIDPGAGDTFPYRAEGWDDSSEEAIHGRSAIWSTAEESCLLLPLRNVERAGSYQIRASLHPFSFPGSAGQTVRPTVNGIGLEEESLPNEWREFTWQIDGKDLRDTINRICFEWGYARSPREALGGERRIGDTGSLMPIDVEIKSFGDGAFIALFDESGEQIDGSAGRRGVNVTLIDEQGEIEEKRGFDTAANQFESQSLADFLGNLESGQRVLVATRGEWWAHLDVEGLAELNSLGLNISGEQVQGKYLAAIGVKGRSAGTALQSLGDGEVFLSLSLNRDRRLLGAALDVISIGSE